MAKAKAGSPVGAGDGGRTYKLIELVGTSRRSYEEAIQQAVADASRTVQGLAWFEVTEMRGLIQDGRVGEYQVKVKIGFRVIGREGH